MGYPEKDTTVSTETLAFCSRKCITKDRNWRTVSD